MFFKKTVTLLTNLIKKIFRNFSYIHSYWNFGKNVKIKSWMDDSMSKSLEKKKSTTKETKVVKDNKETKDTYEPTETK